MKNKTLTRAFSLLLAFALTFPFFSAKASASSTLEQLQASHPAGSYFSTYYENGTPMAWECMGYAYQLMYEAFGQYMYSGYDNYDADTCLANLKAGDVIRYAPSGIRHSIFITAVDGEDVYYTDSNGGADYCIVRWGQKTTKATIWKTFKYATPGLWDLNPPAAPSSNPALDELAVTYSQCLPMKTMLLTAARQDCYNDYGGTKAGRIYESDQVTIQEIKQYNGQLWCKFSCPWTENGRSFNKTVYAPLSYFVADTAYTPWFGSLAGQFTAYWRNDYSVQAGFTGKGDTALVVGQTSGGYQLIYPLASGGYKLAFI